MHSASPAQSHPAAILGSRESGDVAQVPQQRHVGIAVKCSLFSVHLQANHVLLQLQTEELQIDFPIS
jgi:hypothetical protein